MHLAAGLIGNLMSWLGAGWVALGPLAVAIAWRLRAGQPRYSCTKRQDVAMAILLICGVSMAALRHGEGWPSLAELGQAFLTDHLLPFWLVALSFLAQRRGAPHEPGADESTEKAPRQEQAPPAASPWIAEFSRDLLGLVLLAAAALTTYTGIHLHPAFATTAAVFATTASVVVLSRELAR